MEVHHHAHTARKKWTHYFWEFLMLFLAVFCGFLAEYQLEHKIERDRAKQLSRSFYDELKSDSTAIQRAITSYSIKDSALNYLQNYFEDSSIRQCSVIFGINYTIALIYNFPIVFVPRDVILEQLKNSGSLRYFKNKELQKLVGDLSVAIADVRQRNIIEQNYIDQNTMPFALRHSDHIWFKKVKQKGIGSIAQVLEPLKGNSEKIFFHFNNPEQFNKNETINMLQFYQLLMIATRGVQYKKYSELNKRLLEVLRNEYTIN